MDELKVMRLGSADVIGYNADEARRFGMMTMGGINIDFVNYTNKILKVKNRMGIIKSIMPKTVNPTDTMMESFVQRPGVGIRVSVDVAVCDVVSTLKSLHESAHLSKLSDELHLNLLKKWEQHKRDRRDPMRNIGDHSTIPLEVFLVIHTEDLKDKTRYYTELDLSFTLVDVNREIKDIPHPNTPDKLAEVGVEGVDFFHDLKRQSEGVPLGFNLKFVDNTGHHTFNERYIHLFGETYKVPIVRDTNSRRGGLFIERSHGPVMETLEQFHGDLGIFTMDEASDILGISSTVENAEYLGNRRLRHEREINELKMQAELTKEKATINKHKLDLQVMAVKMLEESSKLRERKKKSKPTAAGYLNFMSDLLKTVSAGTRVISMMSTG